MSKRPIILEISEERFNRIPYMFWVIEFAYMIGVGIFAVIAMPFLALKVTVTEIHEVKGDIKGFIVGAFKALFIYSVFVVLVGLFSTVLLVLGPHVAKAMARDDIQKCKMCTILTRLAANKYSTYIFMLGGLIREYDMDDPQDRREAEWKLQVIRIHNV